ncbi:uncharacterized protein LOC127086729 [Lathyrus oleraceus]|uniref:uncharacterized protein LOC127086729 n=1 Tax=Pisum sativum TaxID=3888 RepID=UPI0021CE844B|nr:uncharacterized protein LOC127086729 [Pisum sativum]
MAKMQEEMNQRASTTNPPTHPAVETPNPVPQVNPLINISAPGGVPNGNPRPHVFEIDDRYYAFFSPRAASQYDAFGSATNEVERKVKAIEEKLKTMGNTDVLGLDAVEMCLVPGVIISAKLKVPDFEKYKGNSDPRTHIRAYCRNMVAYSSDDQLLMHFFQDSLSGASLDWYMQLEGLHIHTWREMAKAFLKHYRYNTDMAPNCTQLQNLTQRSEESFKEYAQRWRELATRVQPTLLERQLVYIFMGNLQCPYLDRMVGSTSLGFSDLVLAGERIENMINMGKIQNSDSTSSASKKPFVPYGKKQEGETNATSIIQTRNPTYPQVAAVAPVQPSQQQPFIIPVQTQQQQQELGPPPAVLPPDYDANVHCEIHSGAPGQSIENYKALKYKVQDLIDSKAITFTPNGPNSVIQRLMNQGILVVDCPSIKEDVSTLEIPYDKISPLQIPYNFSQLTLSTNHVTPIIITVPTPFMYVNTKAVPWVYDTSVYIHGQKIQEEPLKSNDPMINITGTGGITRSGRIFTPAPTPIGTINPSASDKGKQIDGAK